MPPCCQGERDRSTGAPTKASICASTKASTGCNFHGCIHGCHPGCNHGASTDASTDQHGRVTDASTDAFTMRPGRGRAGVRGNPVLSLLPICRCVCEVCVFVGGGGGVATSAAIEQSEKPERQPPMRRYRADGHQGIVPLETDDYVVRYRTAESIAFSSGMLSLEPSCIASPLVASCFDAGSSSVPLGSKQVLCQP